VPLGNCRAARRDGDGAPCILQRAFAKTHERRKRYMGYGVLLMPRYARGMSNAYGYAYICAGLAGPLRARPRHLFG
jgi:hypothetical protein